MFKTLLIILLVSHGAEAQLKLANVFSDNMVLQRERPLSVWGWYIPGLKITVSISGEKKETVVNPDSSWKLIVSPLIANADSQDLVVSTESDTLVLKNILIGDVWVCIGQSNMEWPMIREKHYAEEIKNSHQPLMRFCNPAYAGKNIYGTTFPDSVAKRLLPDKFYNGQWQECDSLSFKTMSAVAFYYGKEIVKNIKVPVGLINLSMGGAPLETFIAREVLESSADFTKKVKGDWLANEALPVWIRERGRQNVGGLQHVPADKNGKNHGYKPGFAYEAGIKPLLAMPVKGILCYQGESNAQEEERVNEYALLSKLMVDDFRKKWKDQHLPFYYVQLSSIDTVNYKSQLWPEFRNEQRKMLQLIEQSGMAVCSEIGDKKDIHPANKRDVGVRLSRWALNKTYQQKIIPSGPLPVKAVFRKDKVIVSFEFAGIKLMPAAGEQLQGFSLDGKKDAVAYVKKRQVIITAERKPEFVYYGWKPYSDGNLLNSENLPASTFKLKVN